MEGPPIEGMFRAAAGEKAHWELKEALDRGGCLDLDSHLSTAGSHLEGDFSVFGL